MDCYFKINCDVFWVEHRVIPRSLWATLNRIRTKKGRCQYLQHKWGLSETQNCECICVHTIRYIVEKWPRTRFKEGLEKLHAADSSWLKRLVVRLQICEWIVELLLCCLYSIPLLLIYFHFIIYNITYIFILFYCLFFT